MNTIFPNIPNEFSVPLQSVLYKNLIEKEDPFQKEGRKTSPLIKDKEIAEKEEIEEPFSEDTKEMEEEKDKNNQEFQVFYDKCIEKIDKVVGNIDNSQWKRSFPNICKEIIFSNESYAKTFCCIMHILYKYSNVMYTVKQIRQLLIESYRPWMNNDENRITRRKKILNLLKYYNGFITTKTVNLVLQEKQDWEVFFWNEEYHFGELDFWILADALSLPIILFSSYPLKHLFSSDKTMKWILLSKNALTVTKKWYFVRPPTNSLEIAKYQLITPTLDLRNVKDYKVEPSFSLWEQIEMGTKEENNMYQKNVMSLETFLS